MSLEKSPAPSFNTIKCPSPNFNERPVGISIDMVILHYTEFTTGKGWLDCVTDPNPTDPKSKVSAHYMIDYDGTVYQVVPEDKRAWHAGVSEWQGHTNINDRSIGIELQNKGATYFQEHKEWEPYPDAQMESLVILLRALCKRHPIKQDYIVGHDAVAPTRKIDPGPHFDWHALKNKL